MKRKELIERVKTKIESYTYEIDNNVVISNAHVRKIIKYIEEVVNSKKPMR